MASSHRRTIAWAGAAAALLIAVAFAATRVSGLQGVPLRDTAPRGDAPEFVGIQAWLNGEPVTLADLRGSVVLVDFWTYTCINCVRTFPHLRALHDTYEPFGLRIVGVHSPEFEFEKIEANVADAIARYELPYPIALDNEMETWRAYRNNWWPHVYLVDADGRLRFDHIGEGGEEQIQQQVRMLLREAGSSLPAPIDFADTTPTPHITPEIYAGIERGTAQGSLQSPEGYGSGRIVEYAPVDAATIERAGTAGAFFLEGSWRAHAEFVEAGPGGGRVIVPFFARDVFAVAAGQARIRVLMDGAPIGRAAGEDVTDGVVTVTRDDLYVLVRLPRAEQHVLTLEAEEGFRLFTFTFG